MFLVDGSFFVLPRRSLTVTLWTRSIFVNRALQRGHLFSRSDHCSIHPKQKRCVQPLIDANSFCSTSSIQMQHLVGCSSSVAVQSVPSSGASDFTAAAESGPGGGFLRFVGDVPADADDGGVFFNCDGDTRLLVRLAAFVLLLLSREELELFRLRIRLPRLLASVEVEAEAADATATAAAVAAVLLTVVSRILIRCCCSDEIRRFLRREGPLGRMTAVESTSVSSTGRRLRRRLDGPSVVTGDDIVVVVDDDVGAAAADWRFSRDSK